MAGSSDSLDNLVEQFARSLASGQLEGLQMNEEEQQLASEELVEASANGDIHTVRRLLNAGADVNAATYDDKRALRYGAQVHFRDVLGTPSLDALTSAAVKENLEIIKLLLEAGARIDPKDEAQGVNALYYAASYGHVEAVELLLEAGSRVEVCDQWGNNTLMMATELASAAIVRLLLKAGADVHKISGISNPLSTASVSSKDRAEKLRMLFAAGARFESHRDAGWWALFNAAKVGDVESLLVYESTGIYLEAEFLSEWGPRALREASSKEHVGAVQFLMGKGVDVNSEDGHGLTALMQAGNQEVLDILVMAGATISVDGGKKAMALRFAAGSGKTVLVRALINAGVDVNAADSRTLQTSLMCAVHDDYYGSRGNEALPILIAAGADLDNRDTKGRTALIRAAESSNTYAAHQLVRAGADVNVAAADSWTPLKYAVGKANREMVRILLGAGAEICTDTEPYVQAMYRFTAAVLSILPSWFPLGLRQDILHLVLEQHNGRFLVKCPLKYVLEGRAQERCGMQ